MNKNTIILLLTSFTILMGIWIVGNIYHAGATSTISEILTAQSAPINPSFNEKVLAAIRSREQVTATEPITASATAEVTPSITPKVTPTATSSAKLASASAVKK